MPYQFLVLYVEVAGCQIDLEERDLTVNMKGSAEARRKAKRYVNCVMAQRKGPVFVEREPEDADNMSLLDIPTEAVGFVTGKMGNFLRTIELEWKVLMLFGEVSGHKKLPDTETLVIFGDKLNRRGAELKIMSAAEHKIDGYFSDQLKDTPDIDPSDGYVI